MKSCIETKRCVVRRFESGTKLGGLLLSPNVCKEDIHARLFRFRDAMSRKQTACVSPSGLGLAIGVPAALLCVRFIESQLFEMKGVDAGTLLTAIVTLLLPACLAGAIPAQRAASIDPARALRTE